MNSAALAKPKISVIILNYNGRRWLPRLFESLETQTILSQIEVIIPDNNSDDESDLLAEKWLNKTKKGRLIRTGENLGFSGGNNRGATEATGKYLFFLNNDTWLEPDCLEILLRETESARADASAPVVVNYEDDAFQSIGGPGIDLFGIPVPHEKPLVRTTRLFTVPGCSFLISARLFKAIGEFDEAHFMYGEEADLTWRVWISGGHVVGIPSARVHHRGSGATNVSGRTGDARFHTTADRRYFTNRNGLIRLMKNAQHLLLLLVIPHLLLLALEATAVLLIVRRPYFVRRAYGQAVWDAFRMMPQIRRRRKSIRSCRQRGDFWMLRFLRLKPSRLSEVKPLLKSGWPFKSRILKVEE